MSIFTTIEDSDTDRSEIERKSFSMWRFICYLMLENEVLQLHSKPFYYLGSIYWALRYMGHSKHFIMVVRKLPFVV